MSGVDRYCTLENCAGADACKHRDPGRSCVYEYVADKYEPGHRWEGEGIPPRRWKAADGTVVYRSFADYCD